MLCPYFSSFSSKKYIIGGWFLQPTKSCAKASTLQS